MIFSVHLGKDLGEAEAEAVEAVVGGGADAPRRARARSAVEPRNAAKNTVRAIGAVLYFQFLQVHL